MNQGNCGKCSEVRDYLIKTGKRAGKFHTYCRKCLSKQVAESTRKRPEHYLEKQRQYWRDNPDRKLRAMLKRYGVDDVWYRAKLQEQESVCAICLKPETWKHRRLDGEAYNLSVDHSHDTGQVRGLLCNSCNHRLGILEAQGWFPKAMAYLNKHHP